MKHSHTAHAVGVKRAAGAGWLFLMVYLGQDMFKTKHYL